MKRIIHLINKLRHNHALMASLVQQAFAVLQFMVAARCMTPDGLGSWAMFLTLISFIEMARVGLIQSAMVNFFAKHPLADQQEIGGSALGLSLIFSLAAAFILALVGWLLRHVWILPELPMLLMWYLGVGILTTILRWFDAVQMARSEFLGILRGSWMFGLAYLSCALVYYACFRRLEPQVLLLMQVPAFMAVLILRQKSLGNALARVRIRKLWMIRIWQYGRYGLGTNLSSMLFQRVDVLLLGAWATPAGLAAYNIATRLISWLDLPLNAVSQSIFPKIAQEYYANGLQSMSRKCDDSTAQLLSIAIPLFVLSFLGADVLVYILAGDRYPDAATYLRILVLAGLIKPWGRLLGLALDASGQPQWNFRMTNFSLFINLGLLWFFVQWLGVLGAAIASTLGVYLTTLLGRLYFMRRIPMSIKRTLREVIRHYHAFRPGFKA
ncbi:MAG: polysaccharide biosynthesis C-terminal domain-containing protein [Bacteroidetes bacterium]|nr:polysaccharide biosynthesis C-terminal domain-containing protein [Bacteroidota bacterium]